MKAWNVVEFGHFAEVMQWSEAPEPRPGDGSALIRVGAAGLTFALMLRISGQYQVRDTLPFVPGSDAVGEVVAVGAGCALRPGMRIMGRGLSGTFAEYALMDPEAARPVPEGMSDVQAAAFLNAFQTSYVGLAYQGRLKPGEVLLVHGAAGGVGLAAIQIGKALGATVIATAGSGEKIAACLAQGADHAVNYEEVDFVEAVMELTGGHGADVIYDPVGGEVFTKSRRCIAFDGRLVVVGFASGQIPEIAANRMLLRTFSVSGFTLHAYQKHRPDLLEKSEQALMDFYREGKIDPVVSAVLPMSQLIGGLKMLEDRKSIGKVVLVAEEGG
ncbi:MAG: NADPH:quinone oxidoreductase family protein [SAR324 cluster bacterium]|nr:NADPH:quinone oxidoreductase family protein [SAR324 cluster bacterium]